MKFDNYEVHTIKKALAMRIYNLDDLILHAKEEVYRNFLQKERREVIDIIKRMEE